MEPARVNTKGKGKKSASVVHIVGNQKNACCEGHTLIISLLNFNSTTRFVS